MKSGQSWIAISPRSRGRSWRSSLALKIPDKHPARLALKRADDNFSRYTPYGRPFSPFDPLIFSRRVARMIGEKTPRELVYETNRDVITAYIPDEEHRIDTRTGGRTNDSRKVHVL
jgi:hypothetical protein